MDYEWPSEESRTNALKDGTFKPEKIEPIFMAVYGTTIFLSLDKVDGIPVTLVSLSTSSESPAPPKLIPFPSWDKHRKGNCNNIEEARGLHVDLVRKKLWILDSGSANCKSKLLAIDWTNKHSSIINRFPLTDLPITFNYKSHDLVLDETPCETLAYFTYWGEDFIGVYSLERHQFWVVETENYFYSIAHSPKEEPKKLYLGDWKSNELFSIPVTALRFGNRKAYTKLIGKWTGKPYTMLIDNHGTLYAAFWGNNQILSWNTSQPFEVQRFHEVGNLTTVNRRFTFALDSSGTIWMTEVNNTANKPRYKLLKASVGASSATPAIPITTTISSKTKPTPGNLNIPTKTKSSTPAKENATTQAQESSILNENRIIIISLICSNVFIVVFSSLIILWLIPMTQKRNNSLPRNTSEEQEMSVFCDVGPSELQLEEVTQPCPFRLVPTSSRFVSAHDLSESEACEAENARERISSHVGDLNAIWPITFALDSSGTLWITVAVGAKPYISDCPTTDVSTFPSPTAKPNCSCNGESSTGKMQTDKSTNPALTGSLAFFLVLSCIVNLWLTLRMRKEQRNAGAVEMEMPSVPNPVSPAADLRGELVAPQRHSTLCDRAVQFRPSFYPANKKKPFKS
ncbi:Hypothetical predicted protein [Cloeon dipterum]|uniref:Bee-milk protein n=1 Tax=Cloeon dipterum TaxID=197152 RepID=A0A8S1D264_9INSE|nr:Hypothetical predicted protein [Cloeon dipterum]